MTQEQVIKLLERKGFHWVNTLSDGSQMLMKKKGASRFYAEVDTDGAVNGEDVDDFLRSYVSNDKTFIATELVKIAKSLNITTQMMRKIMSDVARQTGYGLSSSMPNRVREGYEFVLVSNQSHISYTITFYDDEILVSQNADDEYKSTELGSEMLRIPDIFGPQQVVKDLVFTIKKMMSHLPMNLQFSVVANELVAVTKELMAGSVEVGWSTTPFYELSIWAIVTIYDGDILIESTRWKQTDQVVAALKRLEARMNAEFGTNQDIFSGRNPDWPRIAGIAVIGGKLSAISIGSWAFESHTGDKLNAMEYLKRNLGPERKCPVNFR